MDDHTLVVLGTSSQVPTRDRNHNGYFLKWGREGFLVDPGEGTQRRMTMAGVSASSITTILITHFHGDHCLGLPGVIQRLGLDRAEHEVEVIFPASGSGFYECLRKSCQYKTVARLRERPVSSQGVVAVKQGVSIEARRLWHSVETYGYRIQEPDSRTMLPERLRAAGISGRDIGELKERGHITMQGRVHRVEDFSRVTPGRSAAFVLDTRPCSGARELASTADLLLCEATYLESESEQAASYGHMTAAQAAQLARDSGAGQLVLSHYSPRYNDVQGFQEEAAAIHPMVTAARDGTLVRMPKRVRVLS